MKTIFLAFALLLQNFAYADDSLQIVKIDELRPTQYSVGMIEVERKAKKIEDMGKSEFEDFLKQNPVPVVLGPNKEPYVVDHHHLSRAVRMAGHHHVYIQVLVDLSTLRGDQFWSEMQKRGYVYLFDNHDNLITPDQLPTRIEDLKDDPYRSLAGDVRRAGGYEKVTTPFAEFKWAKFFRMRIDVGHDKKAYEKAVKKAVELAHSEEAKDLPGYTPKSLIGRVCDMIF